MHAERKYGPSIGLLLHREIDPLALRLGERQPLRAGPQVRKEFRVVPLSILDVVDCGNQIVPGRQPPCGPLTCCDNVTDSLATGAPAALNTVPDTLEVRPGTSAKSMLPTSWPTPSLRAALRLPRRLPDSTMADS
jgi:hypothetical protein